MIEYCLNLARKYFDDAAEMFNQRRFSISASKA